MPASPTPGLRIVQSDISKLDTTASYYRSILQLAFDNKLESVAFPGISTGIYHHPKPAAATIAVREAQQWLAAHEWPREKVFVALDEKSKHLSEQEVARTL